MDARSIVLICSADEAYRDTIRWAVAEVADDVVVVAKWGGILPMVKEHSPRLVVLDIDAVDSAARGFLTHQLRVRNHLPIIAVGTSSALDQVARLGVVDGIAKPINVGLLMSRVANIVGARADSTW